MNEYELFVAALQIADPAERSAYLDRACGDDDALRRRIDVLLKAFAQAGDFLERPAADPAVTSAGDPARPVQDGAPPASPEQPGTVLGRYKLLEEIAEGEHAGQTP